MRVGDVMTSPAVTAGPDTPFPDLVERLLANAISGLPVVDRSGRLTGIVTEAGLVRGRHPEWVAKGAGRTARDVMTPAVEVASPDEDLAVAARRMLEGGHKRLPVVDADGRVVGVVAVDGRVEAREEEPRLSGPLVPPLR